jgi:hypothetical protein
VQLQHLRACSATFMESPFPTSHFGITEAPFSYVINKKGVSLLQGLPLISKQLKCFQDSISMRFLYKLNLQLHPATNLQNAS